MQDADEEMCSAREGEGGLAGTRLRAEKAATQRKQRHKRNEVFSRDNNNPRMPITEIATPTRPRLTPIVKQTPMAQSAPKTTKPSTTSSDIASVNRNDKRLALVCIASVCSFTVQYYSLITRITAIASRTAVSITGP